MDGTKIHVVELVGALARPGEQSLSVLVRPEMDPQVRTLLSKVDGALLVDVVDAPRGFDVVHRPFQLDTPADLAVLSGLAERLVVTQQDLIAFNSSDYFGSPAAWERYRDLTRLALAAADAVVFPSSHARSEALAEELVEPGRAHVVPLGADHALILGEVGEPIPPAAARGLGDDVELILCIGADYRHKNRPFALRIVSELQRRYGWEGRLVLAGRHVQWGSSRVDEAGLLAELPGLAQAVVDVGEVSEAEKRWLLKRARLVLYPSAYEGFGLVPFEAAQFGVPCLWAPVTSLAELLPRPAAGIAPWDAEAAAETAWKLVRDPAETERNLVAVRTTATTLRWSDAAAHLLDLYKVVRQQPSAPSAIQLRRGGLMSEGFSEDAVRLVGPGGALPREVERPLLALATHRRLSRPLFAALRAGYRALARRPRS